MGFYKAWKVLKFKGLGAEMWKIVCKGCRGEGVLKCWQARERYFFFFFPVGWCGFNVIQHAVLWVCGCKGCGCGWLLVASCLLLREHRRLGTIFSATRLCCSYVEHRCPSLPEHLYPSVVENHLTPLLSNTPTFCYYLKKACCSSCK